jgi:hypothetical protein
LRRVYRNFLFLCNQWQWSPIVHMVVDTFGATLKHPSWKRMRPPMKDEDTLERRCEGHDRSSRSDRLMITGEDTLEKVWGPWYEPQFRTPQSQYDG